MTTIRELAVKIGFDVDNAKLKDLDKNVKTVTGTLKQLAAAGAAAGAALVGLVTNVANTADEVAKSARDIGFTGEALQELRFAADLAGISSSELDSSLQRFTRSVGQAAEGTGTAATRFEELGISVLDQNGNIRDSEVLLEELADALAGVESEAQRAAISQDILGRSGIRTSVLLSEGSESLKEFRQEARDLGEVISEDTLKASEEYNDAIRRLQGVIGGLKNEIGAELIPVFRELVDNFRDFILENRELIAQRLRAFFQGLVTVVRVTSQVFGTLANIFIRLSSIVGGVENALQLIIGSFILIKAIKFGLALAGIAKFFFAVGKAALFANLKIIAIPLAFAAIVAAVVITVTKLAEFFGFTEDGFGDLARAIGGAIRFVIGILRGMVNFILSIPDAFRAVRNAISESMGAAADFVQEKFAAMGEFISNIPSQIVEAFKMAGDFIRNIFGDVLEWVMGIIERITDAIGGLIDTVKGVARGAAGAVRDAGAAVGGAVAGGARRVGGFLGLNRADPVVDNNERALLAETGRIENNAISNNRTSSVNVNSNVNVAVPAGTTSQQEEFLRQAARESFRVEYERELERVLFENPALE